MKSNHDLTFRRRSTSVFAMAGITLALFSASAIAQSSDSKSGDTRPADAKPAMSYETFVLANSSQQNDLNDMQTDLRNMLPRAKIYGMPSQHAISIWGTAEDLALARKMIAELDRAKKVYHVTYTIKELDGGKAAGSQSVSLVAVSGERAQLKEGTKVPIVTGSLDSESSKSSTQVQYIDVGTNIDMTLDSFQDGVRLKTKIEESAVADEKSVVGAQDPIIRQTWLEAIVSVTPGKPLALGAVDLPGTTKRFEIEVVAELVK